MAGDAVVRQGKKPTGSRLGGGRKRFIRWTSAALSALVAAAAGAQDPPQFQTAVELVQLQVGVVGSDGAFVGDLTAEDFNILVGGVERPVQVAYPVDLRRRENGMRATLMDERASVETEPLQTAARRRFMLLFDLSFTPPPSVTRARRAAVEFVEKELNVNDLVAVATVHHDAGLIMIEPFTADRAAVLEALGSVSASRFARPADPVSEPRLYPQFESEVVAWLTYVSDVGSALQALEGRKQVVLFTAGFDDSAITRDAALENGPDGFRGIEALGEGTADPGRVAGSVAARGGLDKVVKTFRTADAVAHVVDPTGLRGDPRSPGGDDQATPHAAAYRRGHDSLPVITSGTGGTLTWNSNRLTEGLAAIERATAAYYVVGYRKAATDPPTVRVEVRVLRSGVEAVEASRLLSPVPAFGDMTPAQKQLQVADVLADHFDRPGLRFDARALALPLTAEHGHVEITIEIPGWQLQALAETRRSPFVELEIGAFVLGDSDSHVATALRGVRMSATVVRTAGDGSEHSLYVADSLEVPVGEHRLKVIVRERVVGLLASRTVACAVRRPPERPLVLPPVLLVPATIPPPPEHTVDPDLLELDGQRFVAYPTSAITPGDAMHMLLLGYGMRPQQIVAAIAEAAVSVETPQGDVYPVEDIRVLTSDRLPAAPKPARVLLQARLPALVPPGPARIRIRLDGSGLVSPLELETEIAVSSSLH